jgi:hypothetical protein
MGFFPLDEQLYLERHSWTPETVKQLLRQAVEIPSKFSRGDENWGVEKQLIAVGGRVWGAGSGATKRGGGSDGQAARERGSGDGAPNT